MQINEGINVMDANEICVRQIGEIGGKIFIIYPKCINSFMYFT